MCADVVFGVMTVVMLGVVDDMLSDVEIVEVICFEFIVEVADTVEVLVCVWAGPISGGALCTAGEANACGFATVKVSASPLEELILCCC